MTMTQSYIEGHVRTHCTYLRIAFFSILLLLLWPPQTHCFQSYDDNMVLLSILYPRRYFFFAFIKHTTRTHTHSAHT